MTGSVSSVPAVSKYATQVSGLTGDARRHELKRIYEVGRVRSGRKSVKKARVAAEMSDQEPAGNAGVVNFQAKCIQDGSCEQCVQLQERCRQLQEQCDQLQGKCGQLQDLQEKCRELQDENSTLRWERERFSNRLLWHENLRDWVANVGRVVAIHLASKNEVPSWVRMFGSMDEDNTGA